MNKIVKKVITVFLMLCLLSVTNIYAANINTNYKEKVIKTNEKVVDNKNVLGQLGMAVVCSKPSSTYNFFDENGTYNLVYASENNVYWTTFDKNMNQNKTISTNVKYHVSSFPEYVRPMAQTVGGYAYFQNHLYVVYAKYTVDEEENVLAVVKYDRNFKQIGIVEVKAKDVNSSFNNNSSGMCFPFYTSNCSVAINEKTGILSVFLGKNRLDNHEDSSILFFDINQMRWVSNKRDTSIPSDKPYRISSLYGISHSMAERVVPTSDGGFLLVDSGDAGAEMDEMENILSTRGLNITKIDTNKSTYPRITKNMFHYREGQNFSHGYNSTFHAVGNIIELSDGYLYIGGAEKTLGRNYANEINESWNLFAQKYKKIDFEGKSPKDLQMFNTEVRKTSGTPPEKTDQGRLTLTGSEEDYGIKWLTDLQNKSSIVLVRSIKIENNQVAVIWQEVPLNTSKYGGYDYDEKNPKVYYMILDKDANILTPRTEVPNAGVLSVEEQYAYKDGKIYWSTAEETYQVQGQVKVHVLDIKNPTTPPVEINLPFKDIKKSDWYYNSVKYVYENNIIKGSNETTYSPNGKLTRGMLVTILWRMEGNPKVSGTTFGDVKNNQYYYEAVKWAASKKVVNGYNDGKFRPNNAITREQLATILMNYARFKKKNVISRVDLNKYADSKKISSYAKDGMSWAVSKKVINGKENGIKLDPQGTATRAEVAAMITNYCTYVGR